MPKPAANPISRPVPLDGPWPNMPRLPGGLLIAWRLLTFLLWTLLCGLVQAVLLASPGRAKARLPVVYWAGCCRCLGLRVRVVGVPRARGLPVVFVSNHSSWMDIPVLGACLPACFISKDAVARWPVVSLIARLGRTVYVSRRTTGAARENTAIRGRLAAGDSLILFPEGTTSDGARVMPFRSAFLAIAESEQPHLLQPVTVVYDEIDYLPVRRADRALFAWFGDMELAALGLTRKQLANTLWRQVATSAAEIRRNRLPAKPR